MTMALPRGATVSKAPNTSPAEEREQGVGPAQSPAKSSKDLL